MKTYDDVSNYVEEAIELSFDAFSAEEARNYAVCHIGCFMTWLIKNNFTNFSNEQTSKVLSKEIFGSDIVLNNCDGKLNQSDLKDSIVPFLDSYYPEYFKLYSKNVASEIKNLPLEFIVSYDDYEKIEFMFDEAYEAFSSGGTVSTNDLEKALKLLEEQNYPKALEIFTKLAGKNDAVAISKLGYMNLYGLGVKKDPKKALEYYRNSVGYANVSGPGKFSCTNDLLLMQFAELIDNKALSTAPGGPISGDLYEKAAELGNMDAIVTRATKLYDSEKGLSRGGQSIEWFHLGARKASAFCQNKVGECYYNGIGLKPNFKRAVKWFTKAFENGSEDAIYNLAKCYQFGKGIDKNLDKAKELYEKALELNVKEAGFYLAKIYKENNGDETVIFKLIQEAATSGMVLAQAEFAHYLYNGINVEKNETLAIEYYVKAADLGNAEANYMLGYFLENGISMKQDAFKASKAYSVASNANHINAKLRLGNLYEKGIGVHANTSTAKNLYTAAAKLGSKEAELKLQFMVLNSKFSDAKEIAAALEIINKDIDSNILAQFELGVCYLEGIGVEMDLDESIRLLMLAAKAGNEEAKVKVKEAKLKKLA